MQFDTNYKANWECVTTVIKLPLIVLKILRKK